MVLFGVRINYFRRLFRFEFKFPSILTMLLQVRKQMAAVLASVILSTGLPVMAQEPAMVAPPAQQVAQQEAAAVSSGGVQNWRYSEFINAVEKDKVVKVGLP